MGFHNLVNTAYFSEAANDFRRNGKLYTTAPRGSRDYIDYWDMHEERCMNGYSVGDLWIPGRYYFYLNFFPMDKISDEAAARAYLKFREVYNLRLKGQHVDYPVITADKNIDFPRFTEVGYEWFMFKHIAWNGGEFMGIKSPGGRHQGALKSRGAGFSYSEAADGVYNYTFLDGSKTYYFAGTEDYLIKDGILNKVEPALDFINEHIPYWRKNRVRKSTLMHQKASWVDDKGIEQGIDGDKMSEIIGVIVDNPNKTRGKRGRKIVFEEGGSFKKLKDALEISLGSIRDGSAYVGQVSVFGCVCAGTEVYKANGEKVLIENLKQEDGILGYNGTTISKEPIIWLQPPAKKECVEITLETGITLKCSVDHPILSSNTDLKAKQRPSGLQRKRVQFKQAKDLTTKDVVGIIEELPIFGSQKNQYAYTTGLLIGDGYYGGTIEIIIDNQECLDQVELELTRVHIVHKRTHKTVVSYSLKGPIRQYLMANGMHGQSKHLKRLPSSWRTYNKKSLALMLAGYFDADGNTKKDKDRGVSVIYSSVVKELLIETQEALLRFGIHGNIVQELSKGGYTEEHIIYRLYILRAESIENFRKYIPIKSPHKAIPTQSKRINKLLRDAEFIKNEKYANNKHLKPLTGAVLYRVLSVVPIGLQNIYNLNAGNTHTYLANNIITHNTGGEEGPGIEGLDDIFNSPEAWDMLIFPNVWEPGMEDQSCGYFVPCWRVNNLAIDSEGNVNAPMAIDLELVEREKKKKSSDPKAIDRRKAEYPTNPSEALMRLTVNNFPISIIDAQIRRLKTDRSLLNSLLHGKFINKTKHTVDFIPDPEAQPLVKYPHTRNDDLSGCITINELPFTRKESNGETLVPGDRGEVYFITVDPVQLENAEDLTSLWAIYVWKLPNMYSNTNTRVPVAWYVGRPKQLETAWKTIFDFAKFYNALVQSEIAGGGQAIYTYAKSETAKGDNLLDYIAFEVSIDTRETDSAALKKNRSYFMNVSTLQKLEGLKALINWCEEIIGLDDKGEHIIPIHNVKDVGFLTEMKKFRLGRNADRISQAILAMYMLNKGTLRYEQMKDQYTKTDRTSFFNRPKFGTNPALAGQVTSAY